MPKNFANSKWKVGSKALFMHKLQLQQSVLSPKSLHFLYTQSMVVQEGSDKIETCTPAGHVSMAGRAFSSYFGKRPLAKIGKKWST